MKRFCQIFLLLTVPNATLGIQSDLPAEVIAYPQLVFYNGKVLTADDRFTIVEAFAVRNGRFLATGTSDQVLKLAGPATRKIDLQGKTVVPGFIDTHQHLHSYAMEYVREYRRPRINFENIEEGLRQLKAKVDSVPAGEWVIVNGGVGRGGYPSPHLSIRDLDRVAPDHLVAVGYRRPLGYLVNSRVLRQAAIPAGTVGLLRDPQTGELTGHFHFMAAEMLELEAFPWIPVEAMVPALKREMLREGAAGMTTVITKITGESLTAVKWLWERGELTMRWRVGHEFLRGNPRTEAYLKRIGNLNGFGDDMLRISGVSFQAQDSAFGTAGELTHEEKRSIPKGAEHTGLYGIDKWEDRERSERKNLLLAIQYGWSISGMHSAGSRSNSVLLEAYEEAKQQRPLVPTDRQILSLDHGPMLSERYRHLSQIRELGVIPSIGMKYVFIGGERTGTAVAMYGGDRVSEMSPLKSLIELGIQPVLEADTGEEPYFHPLWQMEKAVTRKDDSGRVWGAQEAVTREQALYMYTRWAARYSGDEKILGSIEPGKLADLVVLGEDYLGVPGDEISEIPVVMTVVGGKIVHEVDPGVGRSGR